MQYIISAVVTLMLAVFGYAGEYHLGNQGECSDCHVMHASKRSENWTPTEVLLKNSAGQVALCMSCHDGTDPQAPDIVAPGTSLAPSNIISTAYTSKYGSSAGFFQSDYLSAASPLGHSLQPNAVVTAPLSNTYTKLGGLVCSDCHDIHGAANYRNLLKNPNPNHLGTPIDLLIGTQIKEIIPVNGTIPNPAAAYDTGNVGFFTQNNISAWCTQCHDALSENAVGSNPAHFKGHPSNAEIGSFGAHTDSSNWLSGLLTGSTGFGADIGDSTAGILRVRFGSINASNTIAGSGDTMSCLSCHKAHGSKYKYSLVWPYNEGGSDMLSGCQQCHYK
ncbi:MAG: cytochrome c3 family protein [Armatimonadota bacterium]